MHNMILQFQCYFYLPILERLQIDDDEAKGDTSVPPYSTNNDDFSGGEDWDQEVSCYTGARFLL